MCRYIIWLLMCSLCVVHCTKYKKTRLHALKREGGNIGMDKIGNLIDSQRKNSDAEFQQVIQAANYKKSDEQSNEEFNYLNQFALATWNTLKDLGFNIGPLILSNPAVKFATIATDMLLYVYTAKEQGGKSEDVWDKIKDKVVAKIEQYLTRGHFDQFHGKFDSVRLRKRQRFEETDLLYWTHMKHEVFPQDELDINYSPAWVPTIILWIMHVMAGYVQLRNNHPPDNCNTTMDYNCLSKCAIAEELYVIRHEIIQAIQTLYKKRYEDIHGVGWKTNNGMLEFKDRLVLSLQFEDTATGQKHPTQFESTSLNVFKLKSEVLDPLIKEVYDLSKKLQETFHEYVDALESSGISQGCITVKKIPDFFSDKYSPRFFGKTKEHGEAPCMLPCAMYGYNEAWCPNDNILNKHDSSYGTSKPDLLADINHPVNVRKCILPKWNKEIPAFTHTVDDWLSNRKIPEAAEKAENNLIFREPPKEKSEKEISFVKVEGNKEWGSWQHCENSYVLAFREKDDFGTSADNHGATGLTLHCSNGDHITSNEASDGKWSDWQKCPWGYNSVTVSYYTESYGIVDVSMRCIRNEEGELNIFQTTNMKDANKMAIVEGALNETINCDDNQVICGLQTKVDTTYSVTDDIGLYQIKFECCTPPNDYFQL